MSEYEQIILHLIKVNKNLRKLRKQLKSGPKMGGGDYNPEDWPDMLEVQTILKVSRRTVYRIRDDDDVRWKKIRGKTHFYRPDIFALKNQYLK